MVHIILIKSCSKYNIDQTPIIHLHSFEAIWCSNNHYHQCITIWVVQANCIVLDKSNGLHPFLVGDRLLLTNSFVHFWSFPIYGPPKIVFISNRLVACVSRRTHPLTWLSLGLSPTFPCMQGTLSLKGYFASSLFVYQLCLRGDASPREHLYLI